MGGAKTASNGGICLKRHFGRERMQESEGRVFARRRNEATFSNHTGNLLSSWVMEGGSTGESLLNSLLSALLAAAGFLIIVSSPRWVWRESRGLWISDCILQSGFRTGLALGFFSGYNSGQIHGMCFFRKTCSFSHSSSVHEDRGECPLEPYQHARLGYVALFTVVE